MLHPILDISNFNLVLSVIGLYILLFGFVSLKLKQRWYLGEALPALLVGIAFGPIGAKYLNISQWGGDDDNKNSEIAYGLTRLVIGIQLVKAGYELPKKYLKQRFKEMIICLLPLMIISWITTSACVKLLIPRVSYLSALIISACVTCTDPVLSQAIAKGPFADNYVRRPLREFISAEAGGNDGFGFPLLLLGVSLLRYAEAPANTLSLEVFDLERGVPDVLGTTGVGRFGGGAGTALKHWAVEGVLYMIFLGASYGAFVGFLCQKFLAKALKRKWVDNESFTLVPVAIGLLAVGTCGCFGSDETLACFIAGCVLNWNGLYHEEIQARHDSFNSTIETILNFSVFMYLGATMPWGQFQSPHTGITLWRLFGLSFMVLAFRRIPAILVGYRLMPKVCSDWKEALFLGHFGPIGVGAISYVEYTRRLFPAPGQSDREINNLTTSMVPVVYWLVLFSIVAHGLSVPALNALYRIFKVPRIYDHPVAVVLLSENEPLPNNCTMDRGRHSMIVNNRFSRPLESDSETENKEDTAMLRLSEEGPAEERVERLSTQESTERAYRAVNTRGMV
ncbi:putative plasma membrane antiporter [Aspergillus heteromorphus CBS 117.55]|uniref:Putative plasma membrane antiporter n=1 Tax=Aspergillus heteromorphus CBS 117.55 TaxID=1448321 RepID=A0A317VV96_9EURO|nr:putative plasma membrane antiporter [Aspergillus heteromorphus CBS 117.55]PWY78306.1 putative plasma membrane antiporter [Aspergillus heteromorphus CBS 117.55]